MGGSAPAAGLFRCHLAAAERLSRHRSQDRTAGGAVFTGIVTELGKIAGLDLLADSARLTIYAPAVAATAAPGSSIAVNGVCLTVTEAGGGHFTADVMGETLARSTLGGLAPGAPVNLEQAALVSGAWMATSSRAMWTAPVRSPRAGRPNAGMC